MIARVIIVLFVAVSSVLFWEVGGRVVSTQSADLDCAEFNISDELLYRNFVTIRGKVTIIDPKTNESYFGSGIIILFQRLDCKKCLVFVRTDTKGEYDIRLGKGKYRIIAREGFRIGETYDLLAPNQVRIVDASDTSESKIFNIDVIYKSQDDLEGIIKNTSSKL